MPPSISFQLTGSIHDLRDSDGYWFQYQWVTGQVRSVSLPDGCTDVRGFEHKPVSGTRVHCCLCDSWDVGFHLLQAPCPGDERPLMHSAFRRRGLSDCGVLRPLLFSTLICNFCCRQTNNLDSISNALRPSPQHSYYVAGPASFMS